MKKKLIQILMLLVVAVSMGAFVSCKDTNEDLYNELRSQTTGDYASLQQAIEDLKSKLNTQATAYQTALDNLQKVVDGINSCKCDPNDPTTPVGSLISSLQTQIINLQTQIDNLDIPIVDPSTGSTTTIGDIITDMTGDISDINDIINNVDGQGNSLQIFITNTETAQSLLEQAIADLKAQLDAIQKCNCDAKFDDVWAAIHQLETDVASTLARANSAYDLATSANTAAATAQATADAAQGTANAAQGTANTALSTANDAKLTAQEAKIAADGATAIANAATNLATQAAQTAANAESIATQAGLDATTAKEFAETAKQTAEAALTAANNAIAIATGLQTLVEANTLAIQTNAQNIQTNAQNIQTNSQNIQALQTNIQTIQNTLNQYGTQISDNTAAIQKNAADIATNVNNIAANAQAIAANTTAIQKNAADIAAIQGQLSTLSNDVQTALTNAANADAKATTNAAAIAALQTDVAANQTAIQGLQTATQSLQTTVNDLNTQVNNNTTNITNLTTNVNNLTTKVNTIEGNVTQLTTDVNNLTTQLSTMAIELAAAKAECAANLLEAKDYADQQAAAVKAELMLEINNLIAQLANYYTKDQVYTQEEVDNLLTQLKNELNITINDNTVRISNLEGSVTLLSGRVVSLESAVDDHGTRITALESKLGGYETLVTTVDGHTTAIEKLTTDLGALTDRVTALEGTVSGLSTTVDGHTSEIAAINAALAAIKSCTCDPEKITEITNSINEILERLAAAESDIISNNAAIGQNTAAIGQILSTLNQHADAIAANSEQIAANSELIAANTTLINSVKEELTTLITQQIQALQTELESQISTVDAKVDATDAKVDALQLAFDNLQYVTPEQLAQLDSKVDDLAETLTNLVAAETLARTQGDENLQNQINEIKQSVTDAVTRIAANEAAIAVLEATTVKVADFEAFKEEYEAYKTQNEADKADILSQVDANKTAISDLQDAVDAITDDITALQDDVDDLKTRMTAAEANLAAALQDIMDIKSDVAAIQDYLAKQVTGIMIQGTQNPWFGTFNFPFEIQSNVLIAFYGNPKSDVEFPTSSTANYVRAKEALTDEDMEMLGLTDETLLMNPAGKTLMYENGYAGKIYMTINPNTADVTGLQPVIVNSLDEESLITLTPIKPSTEKLQFGFTRAGQSSNGFYEAEAVVTPANVQKVNSPTFETGAIADAFSNARDAIEQIAKNQSLSGTGTNLENIASDINKIVNGLRFDRSGLKCSYTTEDADGNETEHSVYSQYNLAATAFKPLSLETAKDFHYVTIPGYEQANSLLDRLSNTVHDKVHVFFKDFNGSALIEKIVNLQINDINVPDLSDDLLAKFELHMDTVFIMGGLEYNLSFQQAVNVPVKFSKDLEIPIHLNGITVSVPVSIDEEVSVDLSNITVKSPTVVVTGTGTGSTTELADSVVVDPVTGNPVLDPDTHLPQIVQVEKTTTVLVVPIYSNDNPGADESPVGYALIPLDSINIEVEATGTVPTDQTITLDGEPVASVVIDTTFSTTIDIDTTITYKLEISDNFSTTVDISKKIQLGYVDYLRDPNEQDGYAKDENGDLIPLKDENGNPLPGDKRGFILRFNYDMRDAAQELWGMAASALTDVNKMMADLRDIVDEVNNLVDKVNSYESKITDTVDNYIEKIRGYLDKINTLIVKGVNNTNQLFQPFMVASTSKGTKRLSGSKNYPTVLSQDVTLFATTQTMELFVPIAKKHIGVTNVFKDKASAQGGNADCKARLREANSGKLNTLLDGTERRIKVNNLKPGYVYEIAYSALDFHGKMATRKYYISVQ